MNPYQFPEADETISPADDLKAVCGAIPCKKSIITGGAFDGAIMVQVAYMPTAEELEKIQQGEAIYIQFIGGVPMHSITAGQHVRYEQN